MKNLVKGILWAVAFCLLIVLVFQACSPKQQFNEELQQQVLVVDWSEVNLRTEPNEKSAIICTVSEGSEVVSTGHTYDYSDGPHGTWIEVNVGEYTGWVVREALHR